MTESIVPPDEIRAALTARQELGEEMEPAVVDTFVERIEERRAARGRRRARAQA